MNFLPAFLSDPIRSRSCSLFPVRVGPEISSFRFATSFRLLTAIFNLHRCYEKNQIQNTFRVNSNYLNYRFYFISVIYPISFTSSIVMIIKKPSSTDRFEFILTIMWQSLRSQFIGRSLEETPLEQSQFSPVPQIRDSHTRQPTGSE